jgi:hypothetical protein
MGGWEARPNSAGAGSYALASWVFLRLLGLIYLMAFASLLVQVRGLIGQNGLLPAIELLNSRRHWGVARFWRWPTLCWWWVSDRGLVALCWGGVVLAAMLVVGVAPMPILGFLWMLYLSFFTVGRQFLCYQWDILLLEVGFLAVFLAPLEIAPRFPPDSAPPMISVWLFWWVLFRLMFWSGAVKVRSGDVSWRRLNALKYHYETQPLAHTPRVVCAPAAWGGSQNVRGFSVGNRIGSSVVHLCSGPMALRSSRRVCSVNGFDPTHRQFRFLQLAWGCAEFAAAG